MAPSNAINKLTEALDWAKLKMEQWKVIATELGDDTVDDLPTIKWQLHHLNMRRLHHVPRW